MRMGFAKVDITPRVGVPLCGFGAFLNRCSIGVRDRLWARAMAVEKDGARAVVVSCDLLAVTSDQTERVRRQVLQSAGLPPEALMVCATHTHSGPDTNPLLIGWGGADPPYLELLPGRIGRAALQALDRLQEVQLAHAEVPCVGIGLNREYDRDAPPLEEVLRETWRPARPELTDTTCHVLAARSGGRLIGFASYFSCHPVCCCAETRMIHGDFVGVATNLLESEQDGAVGLFLQGANGDVNSCVVHKPAEQALAALDVVAARYARSLRAGLDQARPVEVDAVRHVHREVHFSRRPWARQDILDRLAEEEKHTSAPGITDEDNKYRLAMVRVLALRRMLAAMESGRPPDQAVELQGVRIGPVAILGSPFETFQAIKTDVTRQASSPVPLVVSQANDSQGYAPDGPIARRGGYAVDMVPLMYGVVPFAKLHEELPAALVEVDKALQ